MTDGAFTEDTGGCLKNCCSELELTLLINIFKVRSSILRVSQCFMEHGHLPRHVYAQGLIGSVILEQIIPSHALLAILVVAECWWCEYHGNRGHQYMQNYTVL